MQRDREGTPLEDMEIAKEHHVKVVMSSDVVEDVARPHRRNYEEIAVEVERLGIKRGASCHHVEGS